MRRLLLFAFAVAACAAHAAPFDDCKEMVKMGIPSTAGMPLCRAGYALAHDPTRKTPIWVAEHLTKQHANGTVKRKNVFRPDPDLPAGMRAEKEDYEAASKTYDQG